jgi:hypothetical protein
MSREELGSIISKVVAEVDGTEVLFCAKAFEVAEEHSIPLEQIGAWCDDNGVRIRSCQLGCFD